MCYEEVREEAALTFYTFSTINVDLIANSSFFMYVETLYWVSNNY